MNVMMMELKESLDTLITTAPIVILQFGDNICGPCYAIRSRLDKWIEGKKCKSLVCEYKEEP